MRVIIGDKDYLLDTQIGIGGEGVVYKLDSQLLAKVYHKTVICFERRLKVLALCNSYANNMNDLGSESYAFPLQPAYENKKELDLLCGFSMKFFRDCPTLGDIGYDLSSREFRISKGIKLDADTAVKFIYNVFDVVERLHKARIILGDVNPLNLLYNGTSNYPIIIDLDAAQVGQYGCLAWTPEYLDPIIEQQGKNMKGGYTFSYDSDNFSIACVCFELLVGINPFFVRTDPPNDVICNKENGISLLRFIQNNSTSIDGFRYLSTNPINENIKGRILFLKSKYHDLYDFFLSIFLDNDRINLMQTLKRSDPRHPAYIYYSQSGFDKIIKEIISQRQKPIVSRPLPTTPTSVQTFAIPDSGFSKILNTSNAANVSPVAEPIMLTKSLDPDQLLSFLRNYSIDTTKLIGVI